jgi:hypothetical protein
MRDLFDLLNDLKNQDNIESDNIETDNDKIENDKSESFLFEKEVLEKIPSGLGGGGPSIAPFQITQIPKRGILINQPGKYQFENDILWKPNSNKFVKGIIIESDDVILDFNGYSFQCENENNLETIGVFIHNFKNIMIKNGTIKQMNLNGIYSNQSQDLKIKNIIIENIDINNLLTKYSIASGINVIEGKNIKIEKCQVRNSEVRVGFFSGFLFYQTQNLCVYNSIIHNCRNLDSICIGITHSGCSNCQMKNCIISNLQTLYEGNPLSSSNSCIGWMSIYSDNLYYYQCQSKNIIGFCNEAHGFLIYENHKNTFIEGCCVNNVKAGEVNQNCAQATGISILASNKVFVCNCIVSEIKAFHPGNKQATGFGVVGGVENQIIKFIDCKAMNVNVLNDNLKQDSNTGYGVGFGSPPEVYPHYEIPPQNISYTNCSSLECQVGFDSWWLQNSLWQNIHIYNCGIPFMNILNSQRTVSCNLCSNCDPPVLTILYNEAKNNQFQNIKTYYS